MPAPAPCQRSPYAAARWFAFCMPGGMLDALIPVPRKLETSVAYLDAAPEVVWQFVRHADLGHSPLARALFTMRTLPSRIRELRARDGAGNGAGAATREREHEPVIGIDALHSTREHPGFQVLGEEAPRQLLVGAIGKVWQLDIPFMHVEDARAYAQMHTPGWIKVAWEVRFEPWGEAGTRLVFELRVDATDEESWHKFTRYWKVIGPGSHFVRSVFFSELRRRFGSVEQPDEYDTLPGDELLPDIGGQLTHGITINASPEVIWPWLMQMGCHRAGFYAIDTLDNAGTPSAREVHPELQLLHVGDVLPASPDGPEGFEVLDLRPNRLLLLGSLFDLESGKQLPFSKFRPHKYWQSTWAFVLQPLSANETRLTVRARAAFSPSQWLRVAWIRPVHTLMQTTQLRNLKARAERRLPRDTWRDAAEGIAGASVMLVAWLTPFLRQRRCHWGLSEEEANVPRPGDELVPAPRWSWTHAVQIEAKPEEIWPWLAQMGADRAGFYSYQWLENVVGCEIHNAERVHHEWAHKVGDKLVLHPEMPPLVVTSVDPGRSLVAYSPSTEPEPKPGAPWTSVSWAFLLEPLSNGCCRVVSRFRSACSDDVATLLFQGPTFLEPIGFAMDRRMLLGIRERVEAERAKVLHSA